MCVLTEVVVRACRIAGALVPALCSKGALVPALCSHKLTVTCACIRVYVCVCRTQTSCMCVCVCRACVRACVRVCPCVGGCVVVVLGTGLLVWTEADSLPRQSHRVCPYWSLIRVPHSLTHTHTCRTSHISWQFVSGRRKNSCVCVCVFVCMCGV